MPSHLVPSDYPWVDSDSITTSTTFTLSIPVLNEGDEIAEEDDRLVVNLAADESPEHRNYYASAPGLDAHGQHVVELHMPGGELPAGHWHVSIKHEQDSGYSGYHLEFDVTDEYATA